MATTARAVRGDLRAVCLCLPHNLGAQQPPDSLPCKACAVRQSALLKGKYIIHVWFPGVTLLKSPGSTAGCIQKDRHMHLRSNINTSKFPMKHLFTCRCSFPGKSLLNWLYYQKRLRNHTSLSEHLKETAPMGIDENNSSCHKYSKKQLTSFPQSSKKD